MDWRTPDEIDALLVELAPNMRSLSTFLVGCFPRITETLQMKRREVSLGMSRVTFWGENTKGGYTRSGPVPVRATAALEHMLSIPGRPDDLLWKNDKSGRPWHAYDAINRNLRRACERAGIRPLSAHVLRHTGATWRYALTKDLTHLMVVGGWKSLDMVQRYVHGGSNELAEQVRKNGWDLGI